MKGADQLTPQEQHVEDERQMLAESRGNQFIFEPGSAEEESESESGAR